MRARLGSTILFELVGGHALVLFLVAGAAVHGEANGYPLRHYLQDPAAVLNGPPSAGSLSYTSGILWGASSAVLLFTSVVLRGVGTDAFLRRALLTLGLLAGVIAADEVLQLHEVIFPGVFGIPEVVLLTCYAGAFGAWVWHHARLVALFGAWPLLAFAVAWLSLSVALDVLRSGPAVDYYVAEDTTKLLGVVFMAAFVFRFASRAFRTAFPPVH